MYSRYPHSRGGNDAHVHVHAAAPTKDQQIGMSGLIIALIAILAIIVVAIMVYKNQNSVAAVATTTAATTSNVAVPTSSTTSSGFVDTVICGSTIVPGLYITNADPASAVPGAPPTIMASTPSAGSYGYFSYVTELDFTSGYWQLTVTSTVSADQTSQYIANAPGSNLSNWQMFVAMDPNMTTIPGTSIPYSWATDGPYFINGTSTPPSSSTGTQGTNYDGGAFISQSLNENMPGSANYFQYNSSLLTMPPYIIYINVPSDITYYLFNTVLFSAVNSSIISATDCPFVSNITWNATRLSNPIPEATMPYSSYFAPVAATTTGSGGGSGGSATKSTASVTKPTASTGASAYKKAAFYGGGNVYDQYVY